MRIALFVHCYYPTHTFGTETYTLDLARNLRLLGHEPTVVSATFAGEPAQRDLVDRYRHDGVPVLSIDKNRLPHTRVRDTYYQPAMAPILHDVLAEIEPDVVHVTHPVNHTAVLLEVVAARGLPAIATFTDFFGVCYNSRLEAHDGTLCPGPGTPAVNCVACHLKANAGAAPDPAAWRARIARHPAGASLAAHVLHLAQRLPTRLAERIQDIERRPRVLRDLYAHYARAIAPTRFVEHAYARNGFARPMDRIPFGVDIDRAPKPRRLDDSRLIIGYIGQLMHHKGPDLLVDAARVALAPTDYEMRIYGSPHQDPPYAARLAHRAADSPVRLVGPFEPSRMRDVLDGLDVLVLPSRWHENSPLVLLNALASHTPVLVADVDGMTEFVRDGENGFTFARGSVQALSEVLRRLHRSPELLRQAGAAARYDVTSMEMAANTLAVYERARATNLPTERAALSGTAA